MFSGFADDHLPVKSSSPDFRQRHPCPFITKKPGMKPGFFYINCRWSEAVHHRHAIDAGLRIRDTANRTILVFVADVVGLRYQRLAQLVVNTDSPFVALDVVFYNLGLAFLPLPLL